MGKKRTIKRFQRTFAVLGLLVVLSSFMIVPAGAVDVSGTMHLYIYSFNNSGNLAYNDWGNINIPLNSNYSTGDRPNKMGFGALQLNDSSPFSGTVGVYASFFPHSTVGSYPFRSDPTQPYDFYSASTYQGTYINHQGVTGYASVSLDTFTPSYGNAGTGISLSTKTVGTEDFPINTIRLSSKGANAVEQYSGSYPVSGPRLDLIFTSVRVISSVTNEELAGLENIADEIAAQSEILSAMYGDLVAIANSIYQRLGDMQATQQLMLNYFAQIISSLNSISGQVSNIYSLLSTQFQMLIAAVNTASDNITGAIEQQTEDMKEYFDNVFGSAVNDDLTGETDNIQSGMDNVDNAEQGYISTATDRFDGIVGSFTGFNGSVASGVSLVSTLFERVWASFGEYIIVYSFPLSLGLVLLLIGRISRSDGGNRDDDDNMGTPRLPGHK